jgi:hypothetical protein
MAKEASGEITKIYLHWSAGHYGQFFDDYHLNIDSDGNIYASTDDLTERKAHTWRRNTGAIGVSMACCAFATTNDLGDEPPTDAQIEAMAMCVASLCKGLEIPVDYDHVMTHCEAAEEDDYGPSTTCERWDLWFLKNGEERGTGGDTIRGKAEYYLQTKQV